MEVKTWIELDQFHTETHLKRLTLFVEVYADEDEYYAEDWTLWDGDALIDEKELNEKSAREVEAMVEKVAEQNACEALQSRREALADHIYEQMREDGWD